MERAQHEGFFRVNIAVSMRRTGDRPPEQVPNRGSVFQVIIPESAGIDAVNRIVEHIRLRFDWEHCRRRRRNRTQRPRYPAPGTSHPSGGGHMQLPSARNITPRGRHEQQLENGAGRRTPRRRAAGENRISGPSHRVGTGAARRRAAEGLVVGRANDDDRHAGRPRRNFAPEHPGHRRFDASGTRNVIDSRAWRAIPRHIIRAALNNDQNRMRRYQLFRDILRYGVLVSEGH